MSNVDLTVEKESKSREIVVDSDWCAGCGDFGVLRSLEKATTDKELKPHQMLVISGIGCSSNLPGFFYASDLECRVDDAGVELRAVQSDLPARSASCDVRGLQRASTRGAAAAVAALVLRYGQCLERTHPGEPEGVGAGALCYPRAL